LTSGLTLVSGWGGIDQVSNWTTHQDRQLGQAEQKLYDHLLYWVQTEVPSQLIDRCRALFIEGLGYPDPVIVDTLDQIISAPTAEQDFKFVLNRCCHILLNRWQARPHTSSAIVELIALFSSAPTLPINDFARGRSIRRLRELVKQFPESEQYLTLRRFAQVLNSSTEVVIDAEQQPLVTLIRRYPYLYEHCLLSEGSPYEHQRSIRDLQTTVQHQYELDLSQYVTYQVRRSQIAQKSSSESGQRLITPVKNPTLLDDQDLNLALQHYGGKVQGAYTHRDLAQRFLSNSHHTPSYREFKDDLYEYLTAAVDPEYGKRQFNNQLYNYLKNTLPTSDYQRPDDFLLVRTCSHLLNFLVVDSPNRPHHFVFVDLIANLGPTSAIELLLKVVLICRKVKPYLEKRFSILFNHYEARAREGVQWLIAAMENLNVALCTNFSLIDLSMLPHL
jgi:hypothetical protein